MLGCTWEVAEWTEQRGLNTSKPPPFTLSTSTLRWRCVDGISGFETGFKHVLFCSAKGTVSFWDGVAGLRFW